MMSQFIPIILASGLISFIATPLVRRLALSINFYDAPAQRKIHAAPVPMLGGLAIYMGLITSVALSSDSFYRELAGVIGGATVVTAFGLWDDRRGMQPVVKLAGQAIAAALLIWSGIQVTLFENQLFNIVLTLFWVIGIINALNFQDNMDGLAAGLTTVASGFFFVLALVEELGLIAGLAAATVGASIGFLYYNFNPARLFMGDAGSMLLGFILAVLGLKLEFAGRPLGVTWMIPIIILGIPIFDTTLVVISRLRRRRPVDQGSTDHTSHRLVSILGMSQPRAVMTLYLVASVLGLIALMLRDASLVQARILLGLLIAIFIGSLFWLEAKFDDRRPAPPDISQDYLHH